jgi:hypothetical protein
VASEAIGNDSNAGCRLTLPELNQYVSELQGHANFFTAGTTFQWNGNFTTVTYPGLLPAPLASSRRRTFRQFEDTIISAFGQNQWTPNHINIDFAGAIEGDLVLEPNEILPPAGFNLDPAGATGDERLYILVNDGGFYANSPAAHVSRANERVIKHEMTHFVGRFKNRTFPYRLGDGSTIELTYDGEEHVPDSPQNRQICILVDGGPIYVMALGPIERAEMRSRIIQGLWLQP